VRLYPDLSLYNQEVILFISLPMGQIWDSSGGWLCARMMAMLANSLNSENCHKLEYSALSIYLLISKQLAVLYV
jgi:hypothetical protein